MSGWAKIIPDRRHRIHKVVRGTTSKYKVMSVYTNKKKAVAECNHLASMVEGEGWGPYFIISEIKKKLRTVRS